MKPNVLLQIAANADEALDLPSVRVNELFSSVIHAEVGASEVTFSALMPFSGQNHCAHSCQWQTGIEVARLIFQCCLSRCAACYFAARHPAK